MSIRRVAAAAVCVAAAWLVGCGSETPSKPSGGQPSGGQSAGEQPAGEQKIGKDKRRGLPAPPPIEKVGP